MKKQSPVTMLFATSIPEERSYFLDFVRSEQLDYRVLLPENIREVDQMLSDDKVSIIVTDMAFADGAFVDWLSLWPRPFILLAEYGEESRVDELIQDEACSFVMRDENWKHLGVLPTMIRKVLNVRESLNRQNVHLQISERRYLDLVSSLPDIVYTLDAEGCFIFVNDSITSLGYSPTELIGKHFSEIIDPEDVAKVSRSLVLQDLLGRETGPSGAPKLFDERRSGSRMTRNLEVRLKNKLVEPSLVGTVDAYGEVSCVGYTLPEYEGSSIGTVGIIRDVTLRKREELKLKQNLHVKEVLLREIHHRVKNNLQVVSSLLNLQGGVIKDPNARTIFHDCQTQVQSMAMVHEQLYRSDDLQSIDMSAFLTSLIAYLFRAFDVDSSHVRSSVSCSPISLGIDQAIPLALIVSELVSNSIKHGLTRADGHVSVHLENAGNGQLRLTVRDSGEGLPEGFQIEFSDTLGMQLVQALSAQLGGALSFENEHGASFQVLFPYVAPPVMDLF